MMMPSMRGALWRKLVQEWGNDVDHLIRSCSPELIPLGLGLNVWSSHELLLLDCELCWRHFVPHYAW
ncbi:hypothetical protein HAX54_042764 [Datura stramonium]|uniref:Uncharacterized protein n=1 Tax=Datura stramonium TaxID=4076 RepID=A0ABS8SM81_DATST|nr:hypothetical protein [Datura stramonium]